MRVRSVLHLQGYLLLFCAFFMLPSVPWAFYYGEKSWPQLLLSAGITAAAGVALLRFTDLNEQLRLREGFAVVSFAWLLFSSFGALPYWLTGSIPNLTDALFETVSGFTTTGASILADIEALPHGVLFWRSMTHWIGGIGIVVMIMIVTRRGLWLCPSIATWEKRRRTGHKNGHRGNAKDVLDRVLHVFHVFHGISLW